MEDGVTSNKATGCAMLSQSPYHSPEATPVGTITLQNSFAVILL
jgi:hypothetical protein